MNWWSGGSQEKISLQRDRAIDHTGLFLDTGLFPFNMFNKN
jgi:hypothetical protein